MHETELATHRQLAYTKSIMTSRANNENRRTFAPNGESRWPAGPPRERDDRAKKEITAGMIVVRRTNEGLKFLLLYHRGQYWNFPKGHVEREELSLDAAMRETCEETGLKKSDLRVIPGFKEYERFYFKKGKEKVFKVVIVYLALTRESRVRISYEHQGYGWFLYPEARQILGRYKENQKVLERAYRFVAYPQKKLATSH